ncbi:hypothetical protein EIP91_012425 [Steccherinum ochraceum]|uniref:RanBD1 domain-containing protein n=1 Tax=Steccherinum ochraceum TaxID=92696 RepID=A0A4R0RG87_9APHY|nr:hypothetical protein EIP91_012425 [Steccherinum ochraceum]
MFPLNDFNFVACALATFSAAVGYKYSQRQRGPQRRQQQRGRSSSWASGSLKAAGRYLPRRSSSVSAGASIFAESDVDSYPSDAPTPSDTVFDETEPGSLKRKLHNDLPLNTVDADQTLRDAGRKSSPPPQKRFRSSTPDADEDTSPSLFEGFASPQPPTPPPLTPEVVMADADEVPDAVVESTVPTVVETTIPLAAAPAPTSPTRLESTFTIPACKPSTAFSAFAGTSSAFSSAFASTGPPLRPAWYTPDSSAKSAISASLEPTASAETKQVEALGTKSQAPPSSTPIVTGEEEEDVEAELKGVKLLVKRGDKDFTDGILGHVKLLSNKKTKDERIVFRREPVWKVSMSVRLRPTVRCIFDEEHGVLRLTLKEKSEDTEGDSPKHNDETVVIYAFRRGKVSKSDFADFAKGCHYHSHASKLDEGAYSSRCGEGLRVPEYAAHSNDEDGLVQQQTHGPKPDSPLGK